METPLERIIYILESPQKKQKDNRMGKIPLYQRVYSSIKGGIVAKELPTGTLLPPTRVLADALGVSRSTTVKAYELLRLEGFIESLNGSGNKVVYDVETKETSSKIPERDYPSISRVGKSFFQNISLINSTEDKSVAFRPGLPPLDIFPVNQWKNLSNLYWRYIKSSELSYSPSAGLDQLKRNISNYLNFNRGLKCDPSQILIVSGSLQSLYLVGTVLIDSGDGVAMENPTFPNVHSIFKGLTDRVFPIEIDKNGLQVDTIPENKGIKLIHCTPSSHYPTGMLMSRERKEALLEWAHKNNSFIIENDYEHEVHHYAHRQPSLFSLDREDRTIYLSTFNRLLHPSIRIGYMVLPKYLLPIVESFMKHSHRFVAPETQVVLNSFIEKKHLYAHVKRVVEVADERKAIFTEAFEKYFGERMNLQPMPERTLQLLAHLPNAKQEDALITALTKNNIVAHRYSKCFVSDQKNYGIIFGYASVRPPIIQQKIEKMYRAVKAENV